ncbi:MAG: flavin reductase family protein [Rhodoferax sp.]|jgi:flavin reductase (DIM6/NTAB) family NADH-FMN oxidoreductase RutF|nr:flavin reductase family protein [Rhodoferax sp.]
MRFDLDAIAPDIVYKLLVATVVPRPIAWVTTQSAAGVLNAAPYSFFNVMGPSPPTLVLGLMAHAQGGFKDTARNIVETGQFVVNLVPEALAPAMNVTAVDAPGGVNELDLAGLAPAPSTHVRPPRIAASPVSFECVNHATVVTGPHQSIVIGRILAVHVADAHVQDAERGYIDTRSLDLVARTAGSGYARTRDTFDLVRPTWSDWQKRQSPTESVKQGDRP